MYFKSRAEAGRLLAEKLGQYDNQQCVVIALNSGGILIGAQIAMKLHANLLILDNEAIRLPGEPEPIANLTTRSMTYNSRYSSGQLDDFVGEYHGVIESQRLEKFRRLNHLLSDGGEIDMRQLARHVVILVTDALRDPSLLDVAADYLKPVKLKRLIVATPLASVGAVDRMHLLADEIYCLSTAETLFEVNHYYDDNTVPDRQGVLKIIRNISLNWEFAHR
jgi:predicted phosphoribosyltransferase